MFDETKVCSGRGICVVLPCKRRLRLSGAQDLSRASCCDPSFGYEAPVPGAIGSANTPLGRKAPTILNAAYTSIFFRDGRAKSLQDQVQGPITGAAEMNGKSPEIASRLKCAPECRKWFDAQFPGSGVTKENPLTAIATCERTIVTGWGPFDLWAEGREDAISASVERRFDLFDGKAGCSGRHTGWNFADNQFHDVGFPDDDIDRGKFEPDNVLTQHAFKTLGLRNLIYRAPFGQQARQPDRESVVVFCQGGDENRPSKSPLIRSFSLDDRETGHLINFLKSQTAEKTETTLPNLPN